MGAFGKKDSRELFERNTSKYIRFFEILKNDSFQSSAQHETQHVAPFSNNSWTWEKVGWVHVGLGLGEDMGRTGLERGERGV